MNIVFSWGRDDGGYYPASKSDIVNQEDISLIDCILMDNGGLPYLETIPWLNEGIKRVKSVVTGESESSDWGRETWGVELTDNKAKIYSLHNKEYFQIIGLDVFFKALQMWTDFLQSEPDERKEATLNL